MATQTHKNTNSIVILHRCVNLTFPFFLSQAWNEDLLALFTLIHTDFQLCSPPGDYHSCSNSGLLIIVQWLVQSWSHDWSDYITWCINFLWPLKQITTSSLADGSHKSFTEPKTKCQHMGRICSLSVPVLVTRGSLWCQVHHAYLHPWAHTVSSSGLCAVFAVFEKRTCGCIWAHLQHPRWSHSASLTVSHTYKDLLFLVR